MSTTRYYATTTQVVDSWDHRDDRAIRPLSWCAERLGIEPLDMLSLTLPEVVQKLNDHPHCDRFPTLGKPANAPRTWLTREELKAPGYYWWLPESATAADTANWRVEFFHPSLNFSLCGRFFGPIKPPTF